MLKENNYGVSENNTKEKLTERKYHYRLKSREEKKNECEEENNEFELSL